MKKKTRVRSKGRCERKRQFQEPEGHLTKLLGRSSFWQPAGPPQRGRREGRAGEGHTLTHTDTRTHSQGTWAAETSGGTDSCHDPREEPARRSHQPATSQPARRPDSMPGCRHGLAGPKQVPPITLLLLLEMGAPVGRSLRDSTC